jgi:hypothetical protein
LPHPPQLLAEVKSVSHPSPASWSQSPHACEVHVIPQAPLQVAVELGPATHGVQLVVPHEPVDELLAHVLPKHGW